VTEAWICYAADEGVVTVRQRYEKKLSPRRLEGLVSRLATVIAVIVRSGRDLLFGEDAGLRRCIERSLSGESIHEG
jgi:hypothetical protein